MDLLMLASLLFVVTHLGISSTPLRGAMVKVMGERPYLGVYSLVAAATLVYLVYVYAHVSHADFIWLPNLGEHVFTKSVMPFAFILLVAGFMSPNPTAVMGDAALSQPLADIFKITRHPVQWAILLWALAHIVSNGDQASILFFGTFALVSAVGMAAMDAKRRSREEPAWQEFYATTSSIPFVALATGRNSLRMDEVKWFPIVVGIIVFVVVYIFHKAITGVSLY